MQVSDFHYDLPHELIAQEPPAERGASRMLVVSRDQKSFHDDWFRNFSRYIRPGDCLVLNNTRVFPARLHGVKNAAGGAQIEVFLLRAEDEQRTTWRCLVRPGKRVRRGDVILFPHDLRAEVLEHGEFGERTVRFQALRPVADVLMEIGEMPLPPYIERAPDAKDSERYQTIFAQQSGSVAAPTAGLHFTAPILEECRAAGAKVAEVTLHVGLGTFAPLRAVQLTEVQLHEERFEISAEAAQTMREAKRIFCVGTTSVRTLETAMQRGGLAPISGPTRIFIYPGFDFLATGALLTNFHLPESTLLMLVSAFAGRDLILDAYRHAVAERYRFFRMAIACLSNLEVVAIRVDAIDILTFESAHAIGGGTAIAQQTTADASDIEHVVDIGFPIVGRPIDGFRDDGRHPFGDAVGVTMLKDSV